MPSSGLDPYMYTANMTSSFYLGKVLLRDLKLSLYQRMNTSMFIIVNNVKINYLLSFTAIHHKRYPFSNLTLLNLVILQDFWYSVGDNRSSNQGNWPCIWFGMTMMSQHVCCCSWNPPLFLFQS
jgi:hypothetical protein